ncbi:LuxR C-terminal-related transcriptional regulator [Winogradskyella sp. 3972H.M.0a.05]|uniref:helix-turn-helix and ligand-binding sensor domain-containing protein n=1 Tax=Winogradskyella sp. 3972H.M.0a.05 TaxID=2950277 RepID=UPI003391A249
MLYNFRLIVIILFGFKLIGLSAQELPPIQNYSPQDYHGETQNWSLSQTNSKTIIAANNKGLLTFDGERWNLYKSPNESIIRSIKVIGDRIYAGMYRDFGYWTENEFGSLEYTSIASKLDIPLKEDEQFWKIIALQDWILFQSLDRIYIYNTKDQSFKIINSDTGITKMYEVNDKIYFQKTNQGLYKIESGQDILVSNDTVLSDYRLINVFEVNNDLLIQTQDYGFFILKDNNFSVWNQTLDDILKDKSVYNSIQLKNGNYALGTISHGLLVIDKDGAPLYSIDQNKGLGNNTILSLFEDSENNLWLGLDNGLSCINMNSPFRVYNDDNGLIGSIYTSELYSNKLFIGTNQGLFCRNPEGDDKFQLVEGTQGQVWCLFKYDNKLFCGHDSGTFVIDNLKARKISNIEGAWNIKPIQNKPNQLIQGNYDGLYILEKINSNWALKHKIEGYDISSRFFEFTNPNSLLVSHEYKGIISLKLNNELSKVENISTDENLKGLKSSLLKYNEQIYYAFDKGIYKYNASENQFLRDSLLSRTINPSSFVSGKLISDQKNNRLWSFSNNAINYTEPGNLSDIPKVKSIPLPYELVKSVSGYENILALDNNSYLIGTTSGYIVFDLNKLNNPSYHTSISSITNTKNRSIKTPNNVSLSGSGLFSNEEHNLEFNYSIQEYDKFFIAEYQYQLLGIYDDWSDWSVESKQLFENLPYGDYTFNVRGRINNKTTENIASYNFKIERPWYMSNLAIAVYIIGFVLLIILTHNIYRGYYKKQQKQILEKGKRDLELKELENQKQIMRIQNENLEKDIENKNRELAISTMSLIKKNEFLNTIKGELKNVESNDLKRVIRIIDNNINNTDDWKLFEEAFNNADKDFLKKIKAKHKSLTPNDLRLCAYLRLNLSSKEIAPLLNISPRSVEVKRYRLRKKMNLPHEASLTNYILEI